MDEARPALTTVYNGKSPTDDIVAVHGLNGHGIRSLRSSMTGKFWLGDEDMLPRDIPNCRIFTFSYPALTSSAAKAIRQHGTMLVQELAANRQMENAMERPIIFLRHSVGGIIVKRALIYSENESMKDSLRSICTSTSGILFFGTPHNGCNKTNLAVFLKQEAEAHGLVADTDSWLLSSLETGSEFLLNITDMFEPMSKNFSVFCFREISPSDLGGRSGYVVPATSAAPIMTNAERYRIQASHRNLCKFASRNAAGYSVVVGTLLGYVDQAPQDIALRWRQERWRQERGL